MVDFNPYGVHSRRLELPPNRYLNETLAHRQPSAYVAGLRLVLALTFLQYDIQSIGIAFRAEYL